MNICCVCVCEYMLCVCVCVCVCDYVLCVMVTTHHVVCMCLQEAGQTPSDGHRAEYTRVDHHGTARAPQVGATATN